MPTRLASIQGLLKRSRADFQALRNEYALSVEYEVIRDDARISLKNLLENLRSALDYLAAEIAERHCGLQPGEHSPYFPIFQEQQKFEKKLAKDFPGLIQKRPALAAALESVQPFRDPANQWLAEFHGLNNGNKHHDLAAQAIEKWERVETDGPHGRSVSEESSIVEPPSEDTSALSWSKGLVTDRWMEVTIDGVLVDPKTLKPIEGAGKPRSDGYGLPGEWSSVVRTTKIDFKFQTSDLRVLPLIDQSMKGVEAIIELVKPLL